MSVTQEALPRGSALGLGRTARSQWFGGLHGSEYIWAMAFALPYIFVFFVFVLYPIGYGIWMGSDAGPL